MIIVISVREVLRKIAEYLKSQELIDLPSYITVILKINPAFDSCIRKESDENKERND